MGHMGLRTYAAYLLSPGSLLSCNGQQCCPHHIAKQTPMVTIQAAAAADAAAASCRWISPEIGYVPPWLRKGVL